MSAFDPSQYAPATAEERSAAKPGTVQASALADKISATPAAGAPVTPAATYRIAGGPARSRLVPLVWPIADEGGMLIEAVEVCRMTVAQVRDYLDAAEEGAEPYPPMFRARGQLLPREALDALDQDDWVALDKVALDFLPDALRGALSSSVRATGAASPA